MPAAAVGIEAGFAGLKLARASGGEIDRASPRRNGALIAS